MSASGAPIVSVIVPVYNEASHLRELVNYFMKIDFGLPTEWIFVDDRSSDGSADVLRALLHLYPQMRLIEQPVNAGKGAALRRGFAEANGQVILVQDADYEYDPRDLPALIVPILRGEADVVFGSRFKKSASQVHRTYHYFVNRLLTVLSNLASGVYLTDMETCYKVFRADLLKAMNLKSNRFGIEVELTAYVAKTRARILEMPIHYYPRTVLQGKKINWRDGVAALWHLYRFNYLVSFEKAFSDLPERFSSPRPMEPAAHAEKTTSLGAPQ
jgi:glycosyltransferase involved in cell wall biosynthesis